MKTNNITPRTLRGYLALSLLALGLALPAAHAAEITWGPATEVTLPPGASGVLSASTTGFVDTDVLDNGAFVAAVTNGNAGTVNGVAFTRFDSYNTDGTYLITYGASPITMQWAGNRGDAGWGAPNNGYGSFGYDNETSKNLLLTGGGEGLSPGTITLSTLTEGKQYQIQIWAPTWNNTFNTTVGGVALRISEPQWWQNGGTEPYTLPQYVVGTFTADSTTQTIPWSGIAPSAISLRDLTPAPPADAVNSTVAANPLTVASDGTTAATITVTLNGADGNPVWGKTVTLASSRGATDTISAASGASSSAGVVTFTVTSLTPGSPFFTATDTDDGVTITQKAIVQFTAGAVSAAKSTVAATPTALLADGSSSATITVTLKDAAGHAIPGKTVTLASSRGVTDLIAEASGTSDAAGVVTFSVSSLTPGSPVFTATDTDDSVTVTQTASVDFTVGPVDAETSTVAALPTSVPTDGSAASTITVTLKDASGHSIPGKSVSLVSSRDATDTISAASGPSDVSGRVTFTVTSVTSGSAVFTATDDDDGVTVTQTAIVTFQTPIVWGPATDDALNAATTSFSASDVLNNGTFAGAVTNGIGGTVNGVTFTPVSTYAAGAITYGSSSLSFAWDTGYNGYGGPTNAYGHFGYEEDSPDTGTALLLTGGGQAGVGGTWTLGSLTIGHQYQVQVWAPTWNNPFNIAIDGNPIHAGSEGLAPFSQYRVGTFTADSTSQTFRVGAGSVNASAVSLRDLTGGGTLTYSDWASTHGIPGEPASGDHDNDGLSNLMEYALGLEPTVPNRSPGTLANRLLSFIKGTEAVTNGDVTYAIEESDDLGLTDPWSAAASAQDSTAISYLLPSGKPRTFARLVVTQK